jgi:two-component system sensor histidine kinase and response regulator WspE
MSRVDLKPVPLLDRFRIEAETQVGRLSSGLLALERDHTLGDQLKACMRAAHSFKGAARIIGLGVGVRVAHAMEDCFVAAQAGRLPLRQREIDLLLATTDLLARIGQTPEAAFGTWDDEKRSEIESWLSALAGLLIDRPPATAPEDCGAAALEMPEEARPAPSGAPFVWRPRTSDLALRVTTDNLNRLLGLAGESLVESRWSRPFTDSMLRLNRLQQNLGKALERAHDCACAEQVDGPLQSALADAQRQLAGCEGFLTERLLELETFNRRSSNLAHRMYDEALACRMRPFSDAIEGLPRMAREVARALGLHVKLEVVGGSTRVNRDILVQLEAPLGHLLRNAIDHGIEPPNVRLAAGKSPEGVIRIAVRHRAGTLHVIVSDDGRGADVAALRGAIVARGLATREAAAVLPDAEIMAFLFLPGFTMKGIVTDVSGRGVGLDAVQELVNQVHGTVRATSRPGKGMQVHLQLPVTHSVVHALLTEVCGEPYAFPLTSIVRALTIAKTAVAQGDVRAHFDLEGRPIELLSARRILKADASHMAGDDLPVVVIGNDQSVYGVVVDRFIGEHELVVHPLDPQLGRIRDIAAGALLENGSPVLIVDIKGMIQAIDRLVMDRRLLETTGIKN